MVWYHVSIWMVPGTGIEPARVFPRRPKSCIRKRKVLNTNRDACVFREFQFIYFNQDKNSSIRSQSMMFCKNLGLHRWPDKSSFFCLFGKNLSESDYFSCQNRHPEELLHLVIHRNPTVRIDEPEQIQPVLKIISVICGVLSHEPLQASMDGVYRFHRVVIVRKVMRRLCRVYLFGQPEGLD